MMVLFRVAAVTVGLLATLARAAHAQPETAPIAVTARVVALDSRWDGASSTIVTYVDLWITRAIRGGPLPPRIVLKQLGGETGGIGLFIAGQARFRRGEEALLLLAVSPRDGTLHTYGLGAGKRDVTAAAIDDVMAGADVAAPMAFVAVPPEYAASGLNAPAYAFLPTDGGYPARWHEVDDDGIVFVDHPSALPGSWSGQTADATAAIGLWRTSGMELDLRDGGATLAPGTCGAAWDTVTTGRIRISYNDPCSPPVPNAAETWVVGGGYYTTGELRTVGGTTFQKFLYGFVILNDVGPQTSSAGCFRDAITHGLGHALGLGHSDSAGAMMQALPAASCASGPRGLGADDRSGITAIYRGIASGPFPPQAPTALTATASLSSVTLSWTPASGGGPAQRYLLDAGTASGVYNVGTIVLNQTATTTTVNGVPPGTYYVRIRAQNAAGTSGPSPEAQVVVGACTAPGVPGMLSGATSGQNVTLNWSAPAVGVAQGYRLLVGSAPGASNVLVADYPSSVTALGASGVGYGTYYARIAATNVCGVGPSGNEVTLVVQPCAAPPQAPTGLHFSRTGTFVAMAWTAPAAGPPPASYTLVVGSQTGGSDILVLPLGSAATATGAAAPPGTYYVRVLAQNACGLSGASNEIVVVVP